MKRRILAVVLPAALLVSVGCGGSSKPSTTPSQDKQSSQPSSNASVGKTASPATGGSAGGANPASATGSGSTTQATPTPTIPMPQGIGNDIGTDPGKK